MSSDLARPDSDPILSVSNSSQPVLFPPDALVMPSADLVSQDSDSCERDAQSIVEHSANVTRAPSPSMVSLSDKQPLLSFPLSALPAHQHPRESSLASSRGQDPPIALLTVAPKKPLKSLGSLLDGLREIARNATQLALSSENSRSARPRPNTSSGAHGPLGSTLSSSARPRPSTACPLSASRSVCAAAHPPPHARLLEPPHFPHGLEGEENTRCVGGQPASSMDIGTGGPVDTLNTEDGPSRMNHIDLSAVFESRMSKVLHLPSSPLPVWDVLPLSHPVTLDEDDVCY
ncbi:hypothetical protein BD309DRAFT_945503 [Dichomitus squalens]|nr:hypothetical protein BD309DRAFT_945503 [Dichomitus squalens]